MVNRFIDLNKKCHSHEELEFDPVLTEINTASLFCGGEVGKTTAPILNPVKILAENWNMRRKGSNFCSSKNMHDSVKSPKTNGCIFPVTTLMFFAIIILSFEIANSVLSFG